MPRFLSLILTLVFLCGVTASAKAIDFTTKGQWIFGFGAVNTNFTPRVNGNNIHTGDTSATQQRIHLQVDAVASESLSGTVFFEIGEITWGEAASGGALGADSTIIKVKNVYLDWTVPNTALKVRMGIQGVGLPNAAGGGAIFDDDVAGITLNYTFNDTVGLTFIWARPYNDNWEDGARVNNNAYLDNMDLFALALPITRDGWKVTPWAMLGLMGANTMPSMLNGIINGRDMGPSVAFASGGLLTAPMLYSRDNLPAGTTNILDVGYRRNSNAYTTLFWVGLPIVVTAFDPWNFELDLNYGHVSSTGRYWAQRADTGDNIRVRNERSGWLIKGLAEYKLDWGVPGIFAWYGSGDQGNPKNGSQRMPVISPLGRFTSFIGDGEDRGWSIWSRENGGYDLMLSYSGTWGAGAQLKKMSFIEDLSHTIRVAYWGGTNSPGMTKYLPANAAMSNPGWAGFYLTTRDYLIEFNLDNTYKIYENLTATLDFGYIVNGVDKGTWNRSYRGNDRISKGDAYKATLVVNYEF